MTTKIDFINSAYSRMRVSGLTVQPTPEDVSIALERLENLARRWDKKNICTGYFFELEPDENTPHNVPREFWDAFETTLAVRLLSDFGKEIPVSLFNDHKSAFSDLMSATAKLNQTQYPSRQPRGNGSTLRYNRYQRFYRPQAQAPNDCATNTMYIDDINDFSENFNSFLELNEIVSSYTIQADSGLIIQSDSLSSPIVSYRIKADGTITGASNELQQVQITITTSLGRVYTRVINFQLNERPEFM